ncbi:Carcinoembryonic antigen-related cell adhesion molecule 7 [Gossypium arboreum]|uniref:Carcinoembryonic antigen-related cell adhesion molecule 7 n=1 Tax=Gossypium arboreum TaxID=29729 RepID=A0A0B0NAG9_GOSAR|nr:Carcinoembryonic antigen-related cell adhesion molecule 7 [Gossypium arboreum]
MGQHTKSTRPGPPHNGRPYGRVNLAKSKQNSHGWTTRSCLFNRLDHERVTRTCPCRAQIESNSEKANFKGS